MRTLCNRIFSIQVFFVLGEEESWECTVFPSLDLIFPLECRVPLTMIKWLIMVRLDFVSIFVRIFRLLMGILNSELLYLMQEYLSRGPCRRTAQALREEIEQHQVPYSILGAIQQRRRCII
jgi:hypothetical protein